MSEEGKASKGRVNAKALVGVGIGSAAIVAALLYAGKLKSQKGKDRPGGEEA